MPRYRAPDARDRRHAVALRPGRGQICCLDMLRAAVWLASLLATAHAGHSPHWDWDDVVAGRGTPQVRAWTPPDALAGLAGASSSRVPPPVCPWPSVAAAVNASGGRLSVHLYGTIPPEERRQSGGAPGEDDAMINWAINASHLCGGVVFFDQGKVRNPLVFQVLYGPDHLPRQAQDKHKESFTQNTVRRLISRSTSCPARSKFPAERHFWAAVGAVPISFRSALKELASGPEGMTGRFSGLERRRRSALRIW